MGNNTEFTPEQPGEKNSQPLSGSETLITPTAFTPAGNQAARRQIKVKPVTMIIGLSLCLCALVAWYLLTAKSVIVRTAPAEAQFELSGGFSFKLGDHYLMKPGTYHIEASAEGYHTLQQPFDVSTEQNQTFSFALKKLPGHLSVITIPETRAPVFIDGAEVGSAGTKISDIEAGEHTITVTPERFHRIEQPLSIAGKNTHQTLELTLEPAWADVFIDSLPGGADISVDGISLGQTPLNAEILEGERTLTVKLPGHKAWQENLEIIAGQNQTLPLIELIPADGLVMLSSKPQGAGVTVNGKYKGQTPIEVALPPGTAYTFTLYKDGFEATERRLSIDSGKDYALNVSLTPQLGKITVSSQHKDALIYIDGRLMGRVNQTFTLPAKQHQVLVKKEGYADYQSQILPRPGITQSVNVRLKTLEQLKWETIKTLITSPAGQELKLFKPKAGFTMGASRREQGRRANEVLRKVTLSRPFYFGTREVTNAQFRRFQKFHSSGHVKGKSLNNDRHPVVNIKWQQAAAYCNWLSEQEKLPPFYRVKEGVITGFNPQSNGYRLPTETEWAWAARYRQQQMRKYPWGPKLPPPEGAGNYADRSAAALLGTILVNYQDGYAATAPVGSFKPNNKGLYDLGGNVAEWTNDFYGIKTGLSLKTDADPLGPLEGDFHVIRGSSWAHGSVTDLRLSFRDYGTDARNDVGFRVARYVD